MPSIMAVEEKKIEPGKYYWFYHFIGDSNQIIIRIDKINGDNCVGSRLDIRRGDVCSPFFHTAWFLKNEVTAEELVAAKEQARQAAIKPIDDF